MMRIEYKDFLRDMPGFNKLSTRARNAIRELHNHKRLDAPSFELLCTLDNNSVNRLPNCGQVTLQEIGEWLTSTGRGHNFPPMTANYKQRRERNLAASGKTEKVAERKKEARYKEALVLLMRDVDGASFTAIGAKLGTSSARARQIYLNSKRRIEEERV